MITNEMTDMEVLETVLTTIKQFDYKPEVINSYLQDYKRRIRELPLCYILEIEKEYKNVK